MIIVMKGGSSSVKIVTRLYQLGKTQENFFKKIYEMNNQSSNSISTTLEQNRDLYRRSLSFLRTCQETMHSLSDAGIKDKEQKDMDSFLNSKLERDSLPEDTPLPYYLAHKEPRSISPASKWDLQTFQKK